MKKPDEQFIHRVADVIRANFDNPEFSVQMLAGAMHISRQHLNRKIRAITCLSTREYIKQVRLENARKLLCEEVHTITDVAFMVGFQSPSYFAECLRKQFGCSPREYLNRKSMTV